MLAAANGVKLKRGQRGVSQPEKADVPQFVNSFVRELGANVKRVEPGYYEKFVATIQ